MRGRLLQRPGGFWGDDTGPNPTDRAKNGSEHHLMFDRNGIPVAATVSAANVNDVSQLLPTVVPCPHPKFVQPVSLQGVRAYHSKDHEDLLRRMDITPVIAHRGQPHGSGLGTTRYVVERTIAAVHHNRRLKLRYEKRPELHTAFFTLACIKLCRYRLNPKRKKTKITVLLESLRTISLQ